MLNGSLTDTDLPSVLRLLTASSQTGGLVLYASSPFAIFYFQIGQLSHCQCMVDSPKGPLTLQGLDAVSRASLYRECSFRFDARLFSEEESLLSYPTAKLIESIALFLQKRARQAPEYRPEAAQVLAYQSQVDLKHFKASQEELGLLLLANGKRSLQEIAENSGMRLDLVLAWAARFVGYGLLAPAPSGPDPADPAEASPIASAGEEPELPRKTLRFWRGKPVE